MLSSENHAWFHKQSQEAQRFMNNAFQEYKRQVDECRVVLVDDLELPFKIVPMEFKVGERKKKYDRAKEMEEFKKISKDLEDR